MDHVLGVHFPGGSELVKPGLTPADHGASYPVIQARNTTLNATIPTVRLFVDAEQGQYAASIISACIETTVYAIQCTAGVRQDAAFIPDRALASIRNCGPNALVGTMTMGPSAFAISTAFSASGGNPPQRVSADMTGWLSETCDVGWLSASCTAFLSVSSGTSSTYSQFAGVVTQRYDVAITAGAEKIANPTACATPTAATTSKSGAGGLNPRNMAIWALAGVVGVASVLAR